MGLVPPDLSDGKSIDHVERKLGITVTYGGELPGASNRPYEVDDGPSWPGIVLSIVIGAVVLVALFAGVLPFPLFGIALLIIVRGMFSRFE